MLTDANGFILSIADCPPKRSKPVMGRAMGGGGGTDVSWHWRVGDNVLSVGDEGSAGGQVVGAIRLPLTNDTKVYR